MLSAIEITHHLASNGSTNIFKDIGTLENNRSVAMKVFLSKSSHSMENEQIRGVINHRNIAPYYYSRLLLEYSPSHYTNNILYSKCPPLTESRLSHGLAYCLSDKHSTTSPKPGLWTVESMYYSVENLQKFHRNTPTGWSADRIIHRNIKAKSILMTEQAKAMLNDFGVRCGTKTNIIPKGQVGNTGWAPPEQAAHSSLIRSDLYPDTMELITQVNC